MLLLVYSLISSVKRKNKMEIQLSNKFLRKLKDQAENQAMSCPSPDICISILRDKALFNFIRTQLRMGENGLRRFLLHYHYLNTVDLNYLTILKDLYYETEHR